MWPLMPTAYRGPVRPVFRRWPTWRKVLWPAPLAWVLPEGPTPHRYYPSGSAKPWPERWWTSVRRALSDSGCRCSANSNCAICYRYRLPLPNTQPVCVWGIPPNRWPNPTPLLVSSRTNSPTVRISWPPKPGRRGCWRRRSWWRMSHRTRMCCKEITIFALIPALNSMPNCVRHLTVNTARSPRRPVRR